MKREKDDTEETCGFYHAPGGCPRWPSLPTALQELGLPPDAFTVTGLARSGLTRAQAGQEFIDSLAEWLIATPGLPLPDGYASAAALATWQYLEHCWGPERLLSQVCTAHEGDARRSIPAAS